MPGRNTGHVAVVVASEYFAQESIRLLIGFARMVQESAASCPAPFPSEQHDDWATAVKNSDQARGLTISPGSGDEVHRFLTWYAQRDQRVDW